MSPEHAKTVAGIMQALHSVEGVASVYSIADMVDGTVSVSRKRNIVRTPICLPLDQTLARPDARCVIENDWKLMPIVVFIDYRDPVNAKVCQDPTCTEHEHRRR